MERDRPTKLYHYTSINAALEFILPRKRLRLNTLANMNDPTENLLETDINHSFIDDFSPVNTMLERFLFGRYLRNNVYLLCFCTDRCTNASEEPIYGYQFQRMWAQYGGRNSGVCLELDYSLFMQENEKQIAKLNLFEDYVTYTDFELKLLVPHMHSGRLNGTELPPIENEEHFANFRNSHRNVKNRFFTKNTDWSGEEEYRFLAFKSEQEDYTLSIEKSITKLILGVHFSSVYLPSLINFIPKEKIMALKVNIYGILEEKNFSIKDYI